MKQSKKSPYVLFLTLLFLFIFLCACERKKSQKAFVVVIPSYNNIQWYEKNLFSILNQSYHNFRIIYVDDCSKDQTFEAICDYLQERKIKHQVLIFKSDSEDEKVITKEFNELVNQNKAFFVLVKNKKRCGALANLYRMIHSLKDEEIAVTIDGDDWLPHEDVLNQLNKVYSEQDVWLTHGKMVEFPTNSENWCIPVPKEYIDKNAFREFRCPSHLRTFYAWLFKAINLEDLLYEGKFFSMTWDQAMMFPMLEMAGEHHAYINTVNYVYNMTNSINDNKVDPDLQNRLEKVIRGKKPYKKLEKALIHRKEDKTS